MAMILQQPDSLQLTRKQADLIRAKITASKLRAQATAREAALNDTRLISKKDDTNNFFELELAPGADSQVLLRRLVDAGASIERFELIQPSLHQIFIQRVGAENVEKGMSGHG